MIHVNIWADPSRASGPEIVEMATKLEQRSQAPDQIQVNLNLIKAIAPIPGQRLLEVGCGTGILCRLLAPKVSPAGCVIGVDISPDLISIAQHLATQAGLANMIQWCAGNAETLPFPDASFDGVLAARLLLHVSQPEIILKELVRVVRPGSKVVVMDWDFGTVAVDHPNSELTRRILNWRCDHDGGNNWSGRQLWKRMTSAGISNLQIAPVVSIAHQTQDSLSISLFRAAQVALDGGEITSSEYEAWVDELKSAMAIGCFFASIVYFIVSGER